MFLDYGTKEPQLGGPSEVLVVFVGIAIGLAAIYLLVQLAAEAIKGGKWVYAKALLELSFFPALYFAVTEVGAWAIIGSFIWCAAYFAAENQAESAKQ